MAEALQSYLVRHGFSVDQSSHAKFQAASALQATPDADGRGPVLSIEHEDFLWCARFANETIEVSKMKKAPVARPKP